jgi:hypothetical protein
MGTAASVSSASFAAVVVQLRDDNNVIVPYWSGYDFGLGGEEFGSG